MIMSGIERVNGGDGREVTDLLTITSRLIGVLEREVAMLRELDPATMQSLQEEKIYLTAAYEAHMRTLRDNPRLLDGLDREVGAQVRETTRRFQTALNENERALHAAKQATDGLLEAIAAAVNKQQRAHRPYSAAGARRERAELSHAPLTLDQRL